MAEHRIIPCTPDHREAVLALTIEAWAPVFEKTRHEVPGFVYDAFYPDGWQKRQAADVARLLDHEPTGICVAITDGTVSGFVGVRLHPEDRMGGTRLNVRRC